MKYIELTLENANILDKFCDAALKGAGLEILPMVNQLIGEIKDSTTPPSV